MRHHQPLVIVLTAAVAGIVLDRDLPTTLGLWIGTALVSLPLWRAAVHVGWNCAVAWCATCGMCRRGGAWDHCRWHPLLTDDIGRIADTESQPVALEAVVRSSPIIPPSADDGIVRVRRA